MIKLYRSTFCWILVMLAGFLFVGVELSVPADLPPEVGTFLVASETLVDPRFRKSVILLVQHDAEGSGGLIVNRPSRLPLGEILGKEAAFAGIAGHLFYGGPVAPNALLVLARVDGPAPQPAEQIIEEVYLTGIQELAEWLDETPATPEYRVFTGYAGWAPGQLTAEMKRGDWQVLPADAESLFREGAADLWARLQKIRVL
jgi:putative transcriptional regulator